jgi:hypothetical protein
MGKCKTYLIKDASSGLVKIGRSTQIQRRLSVIKTGNPSAYLIGHINADVESDLHGQFASLRISGEWFNLGDSEIQQMKNDYGDLMAIVAEDAQNNESETTLKEWRLSRRLELKPLQKLPPIENTKGINPPPARHPMRRINTKKEKQNERNTQKAGRRSPQK